MIKNGRKGVVNHKGSLSNLGPCNLLSRLAQLKVGEIELLHLDCEAIIRIFLSLLMSFQYNFVNHLLPVEISPYKLLALQSLL